MATTKIDISIIVVNYRSWKDLKLCLESLRDITFELVSFEVIIVDNFSQDGRFQEFSEEFAEFKFIMNKGNYGFAHACNLGVRYAKGSWFLFLNPDTIMTEKTLETLFFVAKNNPDYKMISCHKMTSKGSFEKVDKPFPSLITLFGISRAIYNKFKRPILKTTYKGNVIVFPKWVSGSLVLMSKNWYDLVGGWHEDYWMYYEDVDLSKKTTDLHGKIALIENIHVIHNHGGASRTNITTKALTKAEVITSKHVYIANNFYGYKKNVAQILLLISVIFVSFSMFIAGILLFLIPKFRVNVYIFKNILFYYFQALKSRTWISKRSITSLKNREPKRNL